MNRLWPLGLYRVEGESMLPTYRPGDLLLGRRWSASRRTRPGRVVVARTPERPMIKRVRTVDGELVWLEGNNPAASTDSRSYGPLRRAQIEATIVGRLHKA